LAVCRIAPNGIKAVQSLNLPYHYGVNAFRNGRVSLHKRSYQMTRILPLIGILVAVFVLGSLAPVAIGGLATAEVNDNVDAFVAVEDATTEEEVQLTRFPVVADSETVEVNEVALDTEDYTLVNATGVLTLDDDASDVGDDIVVFYEYERDLTAFWPVLVLLVVVGLVIVVWRGTSNLRM
jgi:hypothetical protein